MKDLFKEIEDSEQYKAELNFLAVGEIIASLVDERDKYRKMLNKISSMCGNPSAIDACRLILKECQGSTE